ncbi:hypothetical protein DES53_10444 [Roseimicrobium gellanilyticum]|uniref:Uncharacterized protein n=1 Tax=Roseimicrobium gellanilyticum TaxID=748857 RepID=A0A366HNR7_9BACT|nr:hypothetical protein [Roseimicrobium gellanilyticum]RBP44225.1 hypothetical protein DES53_10444 [Roseimicrobium gellanilyticum]
MKTFLPLLVVLFLMTGASAEKQAQRLGEFRATFGDELYEALFHLPETRDAMRKHIPRLDQWIGFEVNFWKEIPEETKLKILDDVGTQIESFKEGGGIDRVWQKIRDWIAIDQQLGLLATFSDADEEFMDILYQDPLLRPSFKWLLERRPKDFDPKYIGGSFTSGEMAGFYPMLVERLLNASKKERFECFGRIFTYIAKESPGEQSKAGE